MAKQVIGLIFAYLAVVNAKILSPRDLADEANEQVDELNSIVQGQILAAHDQLASILTAYGQNSLYVAQTGGLEIQEEYENINEQLNTIKELANAANADISTCTNVREAVLDRLPGQYADDMFTCISGVDSEATRVQRDAIYTIDIVINRVEQLRFQVGQCRGDILCLSPIITEIELNKVRLPQNIETEVLAVGNLLQLLQVSVASCHDDGISEYVAESYSILGDITACVDRILG